jgi:hypothetical protein
VFQRLRYIELISRFEVTVRYQQHRSCSLTVSRFRSAQAKPPHPVHGTEHKSCATTARPHARATSIPYSARWCASSARPLLRSRAGGHAQRHHGRQKKNTTAAAPHRQLGSARERSSASTWRNRRSAGSIPQWSRRGLSAAALRHPPCGLAWLPATNCPITGSCTDCIAVIFRPLIRHRIGRRTDPPLPSSRESMLC